MPTKRRTSPSAVPQEVYDVRRANLLRLIDDCGGLRQGGVTRLALKLGHANASRLSQLIHGTDMISERTARSIEDKLELPAHWMDNPAGAPAPADEPGITATTVDLVMQSLQAVLEVLQKLRVTLTPDKQTEVVGLVAEDAKAKGKPDPSYIERLIKLVK